MEGKRLRILAAFALAFVMSAGGFRPQAMASESKSPEAIIAEADRLAEQEKFEESNKLLMELAKTHPDHPDVYWKIAKNYYDMGERIDIEKDKQKKLEMYKKCEEWAKKGYERNPGLADNAFWMAVGKSQVAQTQGIAATLLSNRTLAKEIEEYYLKSAQAKEFHYKEKDSDTVASAHFALGQFYRKIPSGWFIRLLMGTSGDMDKSVEHAKKAVEMYPNNIEYNKELGVAYLCRGNKTGNQEDIKLGEKYLKKVLEMEPEDAIDRIDQADAKKLLADHSLACGYSRVQQEEVSEEAFKKEK